MRTAADATRSKAVLPEEEAGQLYLNRSCPLHGEGTNSSDEALDRLVSMVISDLGKNLIQLLARRAGMRLDKKDLKAHRRVIDASVPCFEHRPLENAMIAVPREHLGEFLKLLGAVMAENLSKFGQIRKLREAHIERVEAERKANTRRNSKTPDLEKASELDS